MTRDGAAGSASVASFSLSLAIAGVAVPILVVRAGYSLTALGLFAALSALAQLASRIRIGALLRLLPDKHLVAGAGLLMAVGTGLLVWSTHVAVIVVAHLLQGTARGLFWTGVQTHAVRVAAVAVRGLAGVNVAAGVGLVLGPALAGLLLEASARLAVAAASAAGALTLAAAMLLVRLPAFPPRSEGSGGAARSSAGVRAGSWATASAGGWRGLMSSYVPVLLDRAGHSSSAVGAVVALANTGSVVAGGASHRVAASRYPAALAGGVGAAGLGLAVAGPGAEHLWFAGAALAAAGLGAGLLQTLGPAAAVDAVGPDQRGDAIATVGLYRAAATFAAPLGVAGLLVAVPLGPAFAAGGALVAVPALWLTWARRGGGRAPR